MSYTRETYLGDPGSNVTHPRINCGESHNSKMLQEDMNQHLQDKIREQTSSALQGASGVLDCALVLLTSSSIC